MFKDRGAGGETVSVRKAIIVNKKVLTKFVYAVWVVAVWVGASPGGAASKFLGRLKGSDKA